mgnify:CR=1 FL=1
MKPELEDALMLRGYTPQISEALRIDYYRKYWVGPGNRSSLALDLLPEFFNQGALDDLVRGWMDAVFNSTTAKIYIRLPSAPFDPLQAMEDLDIAFKALQKLDMYFRVVSHWFVRNEWTFRIFPAKGYASVDVSLRYGSVNGVRTRFKNRYLFSAPERRLLHSFLKELDKGMKYLYDESLR